MKAAVIILALLLAACRNDAPPAPSGEEANQLDDAEAMLNDLSAHEDLAANAEGPANRSAGPCNSEQ